MAFPASPSNNQVHKEGNRAFVYDSTLGVWDQIKENNTEGIHSPRGEIGAGVSISSGVTFPAGHVLQTKGYTNQIQKGTSGTSWSVINAIPFGSITPQFANSDILITGHVNTSANANAAYTHIDIYKNAPDFTETANLSGQLYGICQLNDAQIWGNNSFSWLDTCSENSTNIKTYGLGFRAHSSGGSATLGWGANGGSVMILQEIKR